MRRIIKPTLNSVSLLLVLVINYLSNTDIIGERSVGEISGRYQTVITPAGYAFAVWGIIYFLLILFVGYQWYGLIKKMNNHFTEKAGYYFTLSNLANSLWVIAWVNDRIALSLILILVLLGSLFMIVKRLNLERGEALFSVIFFVWWPVAIYFGWIILASVLNVKVYMVSLGLGETVWGSTVSGVFLITLGVALYGYLIYSRNLRESALVGVWGLTAVFFRQSALYPLVAYIALIYAILLLAYVVTHAYRNRVSLRRNLFSVHKLSGR